MKVDYYPDTGTLYIDPSNRPGADAVEVTTDLVVDVDAEGAPVGIEIEHTGEKMGVLRLEVDGLPGFASVTLQDHQQSKAG